MTAAPASLQVVVRRSIAADAATLFDYWTDPVHLLRWWGPRPVVCEHAEVDLRPGGRYRLGHRLADGTALWIEGEFECVDPPRRLVYSWRAGGRQDIERVSVEFHARAAGTEVVVTHERIPGADLARSHEAGWQGCLDGLVNLLDIDRRR